MSFEMMAFIIVFTILLFLLALANEIRIRDKDKIEFKDDE